jgi:cupin fold WbuC family metalloprotein
MFILDNQMLDGLCQQARHTSRRRQHLNIHSSYQENCQRLFNAIQPDSYIPPHRHSIENKQELLVAIRGSFSLITFDNHGDFIRTDSFGSELYADKICPNVGMEIPPNVWHTVLAKQDNSILLEVKEGPFVSDKAKEIAPWAPRDGSVEAVGFLAKCHKFSESNINFF